MSVSFPSRLLKALVWIAGLLAILFLALLPVAGPWLIGAEEADWLIFFGRFHIVFLHVPIGVFIWVATMEMGRLITRGRWNPDVTMALAFGAATATATATLGCLLLRDAGSTNLLIWHMWTGVAFGGLAILTFLFRFSALRKLYVAALALSLGMMTISAHFGASSVHGSTYLTKYAPQWLQHLFGEQALLKEEGASVAPNAPETETVFLRAIEPLLKSKCGSCHNAEKSKGGLDVSTFATLAKGGEDGPAFVAGDPAKSPLIHRMELPFDDDDHMPPKSKPQPTAKEIALLTWWIAQGARADQPWKDAEIPADLLGSQEVPNATPTPSPPVKADPGVLEKLVPLVARLNEEFPSLLSFSGRDSSDLLVSTAAIRSSFGDEDLGKLRPVAASVVELDLGGAGITDAGLEAVSEMTQLTRLRVENTAVTDAGLSLLKPLPKLESLSLYGSDVTDASVTALGEMPALKRVYLGATQVTPQGLEVLQGKNPGLEIIMPPNAKSFPKVAAKTTVIADDPDEKPTHFTMVILPVLRKHCAVCHNPERLSGDFSVTPFAALIAAGDGVTENVIVPGDPAESLMIKRINLPIEAKQHMPPKRRPQMSSEEIALLTKWVADGAREN